jgi:hypothetical protein
VLGARQLLFERSEYVLSFDLGSRHGRRLDLSQYSRKLGGLFAKGRVSCLGPIDKYPDPEAPLTIYIIELFN